MYMLVCMHIAYPCINFSCTLDPTKPSVTQLRPVAEYLARTGKWKEMLPLIHDSIHDLITEDPSRYGRSTPHVLHCLGLWLATGAESSSPLTWEDVRELLYEIHVTGDVLEELGVHHNFQIASSSVEGSLEERKLASYEHEAYAEGMSLHSLKHKVSLSPMSVVHDVNNNVFIYLLQTPFL